MKITGLGTTLVELPIDPPLETSIHDIRSVGCVLTSLATDEGLVGEGYAFTLSSIRLDVIDAMVRSLEHHVVGRDPHDIEAIWADIWRDLNFLGHKGITIIGVSAVDVACWDIVGKAAGEPLHKLWGECRDGVKAYASGGLWLSLGTDELVAQAKDFIEEGFRAMKIRLGKPDIAEDVARVAAVREAIGPEIDLMSDSNQGLTVEHAIELGTQLAPFNLAWFEEPVPYYDFEGHAAIAAALEVPVASGETEYTSHGMQGMIEAKAADILMPDLQRMGGYTEFRKAAALAAEHGIPVSPHIFSEQSLVLCGALANAIYLEHMPWFATLYNEEMKLADGVIAMPEGPGVGFTFDMDAVDNHRIG